MNWFHEHPYISALLCAGILIAAGSIVVDRQSAAPLRPQTGAWEGTGGVFLNPVSYPVSIGSSNGAGTLQAQQTIMQRVESKPPYTYTPPFTVPQHETPSEPPQNVLAGDSFNFDAFIAMLSHPPSVGSTPAKKPPSQNAPPDGTDGYAFVPSGLMSTTSAQHSRTPTEQGLYDYGNDVGSMIRSFEDQHPREAQVLKDQIEDRTDAGKAAAVGELARALQEVGQRLQTMDTVPTSMASAHKALAKSYIAIGTNLALVPSARSDSELIKAIQTYNASADVFTKNYVALAQLFGAYGIAFAQSDAGSVFMFTPMTSF